MSDDKPKFTNIMDAQKYEREKAQGLPELKFELTDAEVADEPAKEVVSDEFEIAEMLKAMQAEIAGLKAELAETSRKVESDYDLSDDLIYLCRPDGERWVERRVVDKKAISIDCMATAFIGPFDDEEQVDTYLTEKRSKREDSTARWAEVYPLQGREARVLRRKEQEALEAQMVGDARVNVLDRRIFAAAQGGHSPGQGTLVGRA